MVKEISLSEQIKAVEATIHYYRIELKKKFHGDDQNAYSRHIEKLEAAKKSLEKMQSRKDYE